MRATLPRKLSGCDNTCAFVFDSFLTMAIARFIGFIAILIVAAASAQSDKKPGYPPTLSGGAPCGSCNAPGELSWKTVIDRKSTRLNSSHSQSSYAVFCLKKKMRRRRGDGSVDRPSQPPDARGGHPRHRAAERHRADVPGAGDGERYGQTGHRGHCPRHAD